MSGHRFSKSLSCGLVGAIFLVANALSFGSLIFSGELSGGLAYGINSALITSTVFVLLLAFTSSLPIAIGGPNDKPLPILAVMCATLAQQLIHRGGPQEITSQVLMLIALSTIITGVTLAGLGFVRAGEFTRYIPYPVLAGFLGASALLMVMGAFRVTLDFGEGRGSSGGMLNWQTAEQLTAALVFAGALSQLSKRFKNPFVTPALLVGGCALFHAVAKVSGVSSLVLQETGWLLPPLPQASLWLPFKVATLTTIHWSPLAAQAGGLIALIGVTAVTVLISASSLELVTEMDVDLNKDLRAHGFANLVTGFLGGMVGTVSNTRTQLNFKLGERGRMAGILAALFSMPALFGGSFLIGYVPRFILGALLLDLSLGQLYEWGVKSRLKMPAYEYVLVLLIMAIIAFFGLLEGVFVGVAVATLTFAVKYSKIGVIKHQLSARDKKSNLMRSMEEHQLITTHGEGVQILVLHGYIFFGTTHSILNTVKELLQRMAKLPARFVIVDFRAVTGLDSSAGMGFAKAEQYLRRHGVTLVYTGLTPQAEQQLKGAGCLASANPFALCFSNLDLGMEWAETHLINTVHGANQEAPPIQQWLGKEFQDEVLAQRFLPYLLRLDLAPASTLFNEGDKADSMYLLHTGKLSVWVGHEDGHRFRLRSISKMTVVGEIGIYLETQRSATVIVDEATVCYQLSRQALAQMQQNEPQLASAFHSFIVRTLASRLTFANTQIEALSQ